jgi:predicted ATPase
MWGCEYFARGQYRRSVEWHAKAAADFERERHRRIAFATGEHPASMALAQGSWSQWLLGYPEKALEWASRAEQIGEDSTHSNSIALARSYKAYVLYERGEIDETRALTEELIRYCAEQAVPYFTAQTLFINGGCQVRQGSHAEGIARIREGLDAWSADGVQWTLPQLLSILVEACLLAGNFDDGMLTIEQGLKIAREYQPTATSAFYRLQGELLLASGRGNTEDVEGSYWQALSIAREQEAKSYELRAAMSLARLWAERGERQRAHNLLAPVYGWFTEGFDTRDLIEAKALLGQLV